MSPRRGILVLLTVLIAGLLWSQVNPPSNLQFTLQNQNDIQLVWDAPPVGSWVTWSGDYTNSIGTNAAWTGEVAARFSVADLASYAGGTLTMVSFVPAEVATYTVKVYTGGSQTGTSASAGTVQRTQAVPNYTQDEWNTVTLTQPLTINTAIELWIAVRIVTQTGYPAGCDDGPAIAWKGDLIKSGSTWGRLPATLAYNFCIKGFIEMPGRPGELIEVAMTPEDVDPIQSNLASVSHAAVPFPVNNTRAFQGYNIIRNNIQLNSAVVTNPFYIDSDLNPGMYNYRVVAVYDEGVSDPTNTVQGVVPITDNNNNTPQTASTLLLDVENAPYMIESAGDDDWYKFQLAAGTDLFAFTEVIGGSELDPEFHLYGPALENGSNVVQTTFIATDDNTHGLNQPQMLHHITQAGWYFLRVAFSGDNPSRADTGFYSLFVRALGVPTNYPPNYLTATVNNFTNVDLNWDLPSGLSNTLAWDNGENTDAIGIPSPGTWSAAIRFNTFDLAAYHGKYLSQVSFFANETAGYTIKVWKNGTWGTDTGTSGTEMVSQAVPTFNVGDWNTVALSNPVLIDATGELWIGLEIADPGEVFPMGTDEGPAINLKGNLIKNGANWASLYNANSELNSNWNIHGLVTDAPANLTLAKPLVVSYQPLNVSYTFIKNPVRHPRGAQYYAPYLRNLSGFKIYRNGTMVHEINTPDVFTYTDAELSSGNYEYYLTAVYNNTTESLHSNLAYATIAEITYNPPRNLHGNINSPNVLLIWESPLPSNDSRFVVTAWKIYRNGTYLATSSSPSQRFFNVTNNPAGTLEFTVTAIYEGNHESTQSNVFVVEMVGTENDTNTPFVTGLLGASPNPFKPDTRISFSMKERQVVQIDVFNVLGQKVNTLVNSEMNAGMHTITWNGRDNNGKNLSSGIYFYTMTSGKYSSTKKVVLLK